MLTSRLARLSTAAATILVAAACGEMEFTNPNNPDIARALARPEDVKTLIGGSLSNWFTTTQDVQPGLAQAVGANSLTCSYGNFGMRFNSNEPRLPYNNNPSSSDAVVAREPWNNNYSALGAVNDGMVAIANGVLDGDADEDAMTNLGRLIQGAVLFNLAVNFDSAFVVDEDTAIAGVLPSLQPYPVVRDAALAKFDATIAGSAGGTWTVPDEYTTSMELTAAKVAQAANTMAARTLAYTPRDPAENTAVNWARVRGYAEKGIGTAAGFDTSGFYFDGDAGTVWFDLLKAYGNYEVWLRVDHRVINMMAPAMPAAFVSCTAQAEVTSPDARLLSDFRYTSRIRFSVARGCYHFSQYYHYRYPLASWSSASPHTGRLPYILKAENDLLLAEAHIRSGGNLATAATLINNTRVRRGALAPATAGDGAATLLKYVNYERQIELLNSGAGLAYWDNRRNLTSQGVQIAGDAPHATRENDVKNFWPTGMWRHLPVPSAELQILAKPIYTKGGSATTEK